MMKLFYSKTSPYSRKAVLTILELGLEKSVELVVTNPTADEHLRNSNPLSKVPTLLTDDGDTLYDSPVICEYLNAQAKGKIFPKSGLTRWETLKRQALADGLMDAAVRCYLEFKRPENEQHRDVIARQFLAIDAALKAFENDPPSNRKRTPLIGELALAAALGYMDLRLGQQRNWRKDHPKLRKWFKAFSERPSMQATQPPV
ncbi:MAG TPA: glutathione S-transferase [Gammaproteobacteria bacterium]